MRGLCRIAEGLLRSFYNYRGEGKAKGGRDFEAKRCWRKLRRLLIAGIFG